MVDERDDFLRQGFVSKGTVFACPACLSPSTERVPHSEYKHVFFLIRAPRKCRVCGVYFQTPCNVLLCGLTVLIALSFTVAAAGWYAYPGVSDLLHTEVTGHTIINLVLGIGGALGFAWMALVGIRTAKYSMWYRRTIRGGA